MRIPLPGRPPALGTLIYEVTARCNLRCAHCYNPGRGCGEPCPPELGTEAALGLLRSALRQSRCKVLTFTGGEPCLRDDLETLAAFAAPRCSQVTLITNGTLLRPSRVNRLIRSGVRLFELPLLGADAASHDRAAGHPGAFEAVVRAAVDIRHGGAELAFVFVATRQTLPSWGAVLDLGTALGARTFLFNRYNANGAAHRAPEGLLPPLEGLREALATADHHAARYGTRVHLGVPIPPCLVDPAPYPRLTFPTCAAGTPEAYVTLDPMGGVRPCNHTTTVLGSLLHTPLATLLQGSRLAAFREATSAFCRDCPEVSQCQGSCKAAAEVCGRDCDPFLDVHLPEARAWRLRLPGAPPSGIMVG